MTKLIIKQPNTEQEYKSYYQLRWQLLAQPWDQPFEISQDDREATSHHLMAIYNGDLVGISRIHFNTSSEAQIRYMGVIDTHQRKGIGTALINALEHHATVKNTLTIVLNAREIAIPFYQRLGYRYVQDAHVAFGVIRHVKMKKTIQEIHT